MILTCPACGTRYTVKDGAIPPDGRQVRCANCKHSWHQDPEPSANAVPTASEPTASEYPAPTPVSHPAGEEGGKPAEAARADHAHPDVPAPEEEWSDPDASPLPQSQSAAVEGGWYEQVSAAHAEPQTVTDRQVDDREEQIPPEPLPYAMAHDPGLATPAPPADADNAWGVPVGASDAAAADFAAYDRGDEDTGGGRGKALLGLLAALIVIVLAVAAFWFLAPASLKERLGVAQGTDTPLQIQVDQRNRRTLASGNQLLEVSGKVINPSDQAQAVPPLQAQLRSLDQQVVYRWTIPPPTSTLQPGGSASFNSAELNVPPAAACLDVAFDKAKLATKPCRADTAGTRAG